MGIGIKNCSSLASEFYQFLVSARNDGKASMTLGAASNYAADVDQLEVFLLRGVIVRSKNSSPAISVEEDTARKSALLGVTQEKIEQFFAALIKDGGSSNTNARKTSSLRKFFNWMQSTNWIKSNPMKELRAPKVVVPPIKYLSKEETEKLLAACQSARTPFERKTALSIRVFLASGVSDGEILSLAQGDFEQTEIISVRKNGCGELRNVKIPNELWDEVRQYLAGCPIGTLLFRNKRGAPLSLRSIHRNISIFCNRKELPGCITPRLLRHTYVARLVEARTPLQIIRLQRGLKSTDSLMRRFRRPVSTESLMPHRQAIGT